MKDVQASGSRNGLSSACMSRGEYDGGRGGGRGDGDGDGYGYGGYGHGGQGLLTDGGSNNIGDLHVEPPLLSTQRDRVEVRKVRCAHFNRTDRADRLTTDQTSILRVLLVVSTLTRDDFAPPLPRSPSQRDCSQSTVTTQNQQPALGYFFPKLSRFSYSSRFRLQSIKFIRAIRTTPATRWTPERPTHYARYTLHQVVPAMVHRRVRSTGSDPSSSDYSNESLSPVSKQRRQSMTMARITSCSSIASQAFHARSVCSAYTDAGIGNRTYLGGGGGGSWYGGSSVGSTSSLGGVGASFSGDGRGAAGKRGGASDHQSSSESSVSTMTDFAAAAAPSSRF